jgi:hypothetical protein
MRRWVAQAVEVEAREPVGDWVGVRVVLSAFLVSDGDTPAVQVGRRIEVPLTDHMLRSIASMAEVPAEVRAAWRTLEAAFGPLTSDRQLLAHLATVRRWLHGDWPPPRMDVWDAPAVDTRTL